MNRKQFVKFAGLNAAVAVTGGLVGCANNKPTNAVPPASVTAKGATPGKAVYVPNGKNRFQRELMIWGIIPFQIKVSGKDTDGSFFIFEHAKMSKGGPPRHFHYNQDEWFYAMEGKFEGGTRAGVALIGQPNVEARRLDNPIEVPGALSFLAYGHFGSFVHGLNDFPKDAWPDNLELLYYSFHIMITLGTLFIVLMGFATLQNWRGRLESSRLLLWVLILAFPYPYIANTLGWMTAELGRQPWLIYGLFHTRDGYSKVVSNGDAIFTLIGFTGLYFVIGLLFLGLTGLEIGKGPDNEVALAPRKEAVLV